MKEDGSVYGKQVHPTPPFPLEGWVDFDGDEDKVLTAGALHTKRTQTGGDLEGITTNDYSERWEESIALRDAERDAATTHYGNEMHEALTECADAAEYVGADDYRHDPYGAALQVMMADVDLYKVEAYVDHNGSTNGAAETGEFDDAPVQIVDALMNGQLGGDEWKNLATKCSSIVEEMQEAGFSY